MPACHSRRIRPRHAARAAATAVTAAAALATAAAPAAAMNLVNEDQAVVGRQCVGVVCSAIDRPAFALQVHTTDTPGIRLEQSSGGGFDPYTWDVAGNEANFFVRDLTGGSRLPLRIFPGSPTNALTLRPAGVGIGTSNPASALEVNQAGARLTVTDSDAADGARVLADLVNRGAPLLRFADTAPDGQDWIVGAGAEGAFAVRDAATGSPEAFLVTPAGTATARGVLQQSADPALRADVQPIDGAALLARLRGLEVTSWSTAGDASGARHLGPSGAGFRGAFGVGGGDGAIAPADLAAVALVAAQQLARETEALDARLDAAEAALARTPGGVGLAPLERAVTNLTGRTDDLAARLGAAERLRRENAALRRRVAQLEQGRRTQAGKLRTVAERQRAADRRITRLTGLVEQLLAER